MQYTIRDIPQEVDRAIRAKARSSGKSLNETVVSVLRESLHVAIPARKRDLSGFIGSWVEDPAFDKAIADGDRVDPEDWQ